MLKIIVITDLGVGWERGRVFSPDGIIGALSATDYKDPPKVLVEKRDERNSMDRECLPDKNER